MGYPNTPEIPVNSKYTYENVDDFITTPDISELARALDPEYMNSIDSLVPIINPYAIPSVGNMNQPIPTRSSSTYDPLKQQTPPDISTEEGMNRRLDNIFAQQESIQPIFEEQDPIKANIVSSNFERYYNHPKYSELGFHPYRDNESYYNANSTIWDDMTRMRGQLANLTSTGFVSAYRSWGDMFDDDSYFTGTDLDSAREFSDAMRIGNSSREGVGHFINNIVLQSGYTFGIIGSIAIEELALAAGTALTAGFLAPGATLKTGKNIERLGRSITDIFGVKRAYSGTNAMLQSFNNADKARDFYSTIKAGGIAVGAGLAKALAPETIFAIKRLGTAKNATQNLSNIVKAGSFYGGVYRDIRGLNYALSESKMEGGMVYDQVVANGYAIKSAENNGGSLTDKQLQAVIEGANNAAFYTTLTNAPVIYLTNQLTLGNAFGAYRKSLSRLIGDGFKGLPKGIAKGKTFIKGKAAKDVFVNVGDGFKGYLKRIKTVGIGRAGMGATLRYFSANVGEGIQELAQEAIAHGTEHYWQAIIKDPAAQNWDVWKTSVSSAIGSQFGAQGFETFMSGFLMGGIVQGPQKILFQGVPGLKNHIFNGEELRQYKNNKKRYTDSLVDMYNKQWNRGVVNDLNLLLDPAKTNLVAQKTVSEENLQNALNQSQYDYMDGQQFSRFQNAVTIMDNGSMHLFEEQMKDYLKLTDQELAEAFPSFKDDAESGKIRSRIQKQLTYIKEFQKDYAKEKDQNPSPFDPDAHKEGTKEWQDELLNEKAWNHARYLALFTKVDFKETLKRMNSIYETLQNDPVFEGMAANDITVILSKTGLTRELELLKKELELLDDSTENAEQKKNKKIKYKYLSQISDVLYSEKNQKDGEFDSAKIDLFYKRFRMYIKQLAGIKHREKKVFEDEAAIQEVLIKAIDHIKLGERADAYARSIELLNNPESFKEIADRQAVYFKEMQKNAKKYFEENVKDDIKNNEINQFLNALATQGVYVDPEQLEVFIKTGDVDAITKYYGEHGTISETNPIIDYIKRIYTTATAEPVVEDEAESEIEDDESDFVKTDKDVVDLLDQFKLEQGPNVKIFNTLETESPFISKLLNYYYNIYAQQAGKSNKVPIDFKTWIKQDDAKAFIAAYVNIKNLYWNWLKNTRNPTLEGEVLRINFERDLLFDTFLKLHVKDDNLNAILNKSNVTIDEFKVGMKKPGSKPRTSKPGEVDLDDLEGEYDLDGLIPQHGETGETEDTDDTETEDTETEDEGLDETDDIDIDELETDDEGSDIDLEGIESQEETSIRQKRLEIEKNRKIDKEQVRTISPDKYLIGETTYKAAYSKLRQYLTDVLGWESKKIGYKDGNITYGELKIPADVSKTEKGIVKIKIRIYKIIDAKYNAEIAASLTPKAKTKTKATPKAKHIGKNFKLTSRVTVENKKRKTIWTIKNKDGTPLTDKQIKDFKLRSKGVYRSKKYALKAFNKLEGAQKQTAGKGEFTFAGEIFNEFGLVYQDKNGKTTKFVVVSMKRYMGKETSELYLIPADDFNKYDAAGRRNADETRRLTVEDYKAGGYYQQSKKITKERDKIVKLKIDDAIDIYPPNYIGKERYEQIIGLLTPKEKAKITIEIKKNEHAGKRTGEFLYRKLEDGSIDPDSINRNIPRKVEAYEVRVVIDRVTLKRINALLSEENRLKNGTIGFIPTGSLELLNDEGIRIDINEITPEQVKTIFGKIKPDQLERIKNNFAKQALLIEAIRKKLGKKNTVTTTLSKLSKDDKFSLDIGGSPVYSKKEGAKKVRYKLDELEHSKVYGHTVILRNVTNEDGTISSDWITDITDLFERIEFIKKIEGEIPANLLEAAKKNQGYTAVIKLPNGKYAFAPLKTEPLDNESLIELAETFIARAKLTIEENLDEEGPLLSDHKVKEGSFNNDFNNKQTQSYFITTKPGYTAKLFVASDGRINIKVWDKTTVKDGKSRPDLIMQVTTATRQGTLDLSENEGETLLNGLIAMANEALETYFKSPEGKGKKKFTITKNNFRQSLPLEKRDAHNNILVEGASIEEIVEKTDTDVEPKLFNNFRYQLNADPTIVSQFRDVKTIAANLSAKKKAPAKKAKSKAKTKAEEALETTEEKEKNVTIDRIKELTKLIEAREIQLVREKKKRTVINNDKEIKKWAEEKADLIKKQTADKIISENYTEKDIEDLDTFIAWAKENLPSFITVKDIDELRDNLITNGVRVGAFGLMLNGIAGNLKAIDGTIYTGANSPFKYHEAFHSVFRMLLTDEQIDKYLRIAKKELRAKFRSEGKSYGKQKEKFRNSAEKYKALSEKELDDLFVEEYMADQFDKFKMNPKSTKTDSAIKNLFNRFINWVLSFFKRFTKSELLTLYENIDSGKFKSSNTLDNRFTNSLFQGTAMVADAILPYADYIGEAGVVSYETLNIFTATSIIDQIAGRIILKELESTDPTFALESTFNKEGELIEEGIIDESIDAYANLYDQDRYLNSNLTDKAISEIIKINKLFNNPEYYKHIKKAVIKKLALVDISEQYIRDKNEALEESKGSRNAEKFDKNQELIGGHKSLPAFVRKYFATVTVVGKDKFGNEWLTEPEYDKNGKLIKEGERIILPVNAAEAYNGFLKATKNTTDPFEVIKKLVVFSANNSQTEAIVNKLLLDVGLKKQDILDMGIDTQSIKKPLLLQRIIKAFENFRVPYMFFHMDSQSKIVYGYSASQRDDANSQIDRWGQAYRLLADKLDQKYKGLNTTRREYAVSKLSEWMTAIQDVQYLFLDKKDSKGNIIKTGDELLNEFSTEIAFELNELLGISLSPLYVAYTILATKNVVISPYQRTLKFSNLDAYSVSVEDLSIMKQLVTTPKGYIFSTTVKGMDTKLKKIAMGNAEFDESVGASTFLNAEGELVYGHQLPTYHLKKWLGLNDTNKENKLNALKNSDPYLELNQLLNSPAFQQLSYEGRLAIIRVAGIKSGQFKDDTVNPEDISAGKDPGVNYGDLSPQEFALMLINAYTASLKLGSGDIDVVRYKDENGIEQESALAPILIRVLEASSTGDMVFVPVIKAVKKGKANENIITDEVVDAFINNIKSEFHRIQKESNPETATYNKNTGEGQLKVGYNAKADSSNWENTMTETISYDENGRAFKLHKSGTLLNATEIEEQKLDLSLSAHETTYNRVKAGTEKLLIYRKKDLSKIGFAVQNEERTARLRVIGDKDSKPVTIKIKYNDNVKLDVKNDPQKQADYIDHFASALSKNKAEGPHRVYSEKDKQVYWTPDKKVADFLSGRQEMAIYEIIDLKDESKQQELDKFATELKETLEKLARDNTKKTFEDIVEGVEGMSMDILKEYIREKLHIDFKNFNTDLQNFGLINEISSLITQNVTLGNGVHNEKTRKSADLLNLKSQDIEYNLMQIYLNDYVNTTSVNQLLIGDHAISLKSAVDAIKRAKGQNAAIISAYSKIADPSVGVNKPVTSYDLIALTESYAKSGITGDRIEVADGQLYMTIKGFRHTWFGIGKLTKAQSILLDKVANGENITIDEVLGALNSKGYVKKGEMLNAKKFVYADGETFLKMSALVLTPQLTSIRVKDITENGVTRTIWKAKRNRAPLHNLREKMEAYEEKYDTITLSAPRSTLKMMQVNVNNINDMAQIDPSQQAITKEMTHTLSAEYFGLQVVNPSNKQIVIDPTQIKALITSEQKDDTIVIIDGQEHTIGEIRKAYHGTVGTRVIMNYKDKRNLVYNFDLNMAMDELHKSVKKQQITPDLYTFLRYAKESLLATNSSSNLLAFFDTTLNGEQRYSLNNPIPIRKFEQLFLAYFSKGILSERIPGDTITISSDFGMRIYRIVYSVDENGLPDKQEVIRENIFHEDTKYSDADIALHIDEVNGKPAKKLGSDENLKNLATLVKQSKGKGVIIVDRLRHNMKKYDMKGVPENWKYLKERYTEGLMPSLNKAVFNNIESKYLTYTSSEVEEFFRDYIVEEAAEGKAKNLKFINRARRKFAKEFGFKIKTDKKGNVSFLTTTLSMPDVVGKMFATRIPSQDKHSALNVVMVDFLPVFYGSTGVFSRELIEISGADFDIDKLFVQMKEYYFKYGKFHEYGKAESEKEKYADYIHYANKKVNQKGSVLAEALFKYKGEDGEGNREIDEEINLHGKKVDWRLTDDQFDKIKDAGLSEESIIALSMLGLPRSFEEYTQYKKDNPLIVKYKDKNGKQVEKNVSEPYTAPLNNRALDYKSALLGNDYMTEGLQVYVDKNGRESTTKTTGSKKVKGKKTTPIAYESANIKPLTDLWKDFIDMLPEWAQKRLEGDIDVDNMFGKTKAYGNNQEGDRNIGAAVLPSVYLSILGELGITVNKIELRDVDIGSIIKIDGIDYVKFGEQFEKKSNGKLGNRTQYIMSALITAMTDNAKERMAAKLGLNKNALAVVANMTSLGVPIETSLLLVNNPYIQHAYYLKSRGKRINFRKLITDRVDILRAAIKNHGGESALASTLNLSTKMLEESINNLNLLPTDTIEETEDAGLIGKLREEKITLNDLNAEIVILNEFLKAYDIAEFTRNIGVLIQNMKGFGTSMESILRKDDAIEALGLNLTEGEYESKKDDFPIDVRRVFLTDETFHGAYFKIYQEFTKELLPQTFTQSTKLFKNILSTVESNLKTLPAKDKLNISYDLLSYLTIKAYETQRLKANSQSIGSLTNDLIYQGANTSSIIDYIKSLRAKPQYKDNFFLNNFIILEEYDAEGNTTGLNLAVANTFNRLNDIQKVALQDGFAELWYDSTTRPIAMAIVHYAMVKDGLMYRYAGLTDAIVPIALEHYLIQAGATLTQLINDTNQGFEQLFGISKDELINEFIDGYFTSASFSVIKRFVPTLRNINQYGNPETTRRNLLIKPIEDIISESKLKPSITYISSVNEKNKKKKATAASTKKLKNAFLINYKKPKTKDGYFSNSLEDRVQFRTQITRDLNVIKKALGLTENQKIIDANQRILLDKNIIPKEVLDHYKTSVLEREVSIIDDLASIFKEEFGFDILLGESFLDVSTILKEIYIDGSKGKRTLKINPYYYRKSLETEDNIKQYYPPYKSPKAYKRLMSFMKSKGFKSVITKKGEKSYTEFELPKIYEIRLKVGVERRGFKYIDKYQYIQFKLNKIYSVDPAKGAITENNKIAIGSYAEYDATLTDGSIAQWPGGFMFGERNSFEETKPKPKTDNFIDIDDLLESEYNLDFESIIPQHGAEATTKKVGEDPFDIDLDDVVGQFEPKIITPITPESKSKVDTTSVTNDIIGDNKGEEYNKLKDFIESFRPITEASIVKDLIDNKWITKKEYDESAGLVDLLMNKYDDNLTTTMDEFIEELNKCIIIF